MYEAVLPALNQFLANIAVLDLDGVIVSVNNGWKIFGRQNGLRDPDHCIGRNYMEACRTPDTPESFLVELAQLISGERASLLRWYPCHHPDGLQRWYVLIGIRNEPQRRIVMSHVDVTPVTNEHFFEQLSIQRPDLASK